MVPRVRRSRGRNYSRFARRAGNIEHLDENQALRYGYYLLHMSKFMNNRSITTGSHKAALSFFIKCVKAIGKIDLLHEHIDDLISSLERKNILKIDESTGEKGFFDGTNIPMKYEDDRAIDRAIDPYEDDFDSISEVIQFSRCLLASDKISFTSIIRKILFSDASGKSSSGKLPKALMEKIFDVSQIQFLMNSVGLNKDEAFFIYLRYQLENNGQLRRIFNELDRTDNEGLSIYASILGITEKELTYIERSDQKLKSFGFIETDNSYNLDLDECFQTLSIEPYFSDFLKLQDCRKAYPLSSFSVPEESTEILLDLVKNDNPFSVLFYGKPGSGKTELARTIGKLSGKKVYVFKNDAETNRQNTNLLSRLTCLLSMKGEDSLLIIDEAETILKTSEFSFFGRVPTGKKGTVNKMLEENNSKIIWIINHTSLIDESTLRRFTYSIKFESMSVSMLKSIASSKLNALKISAETKKKLLDTLTLYNVTGASVDNLVKIIQNMDGMDEERLLSKAKSVIKENSLLLNGKSKLRKTTCKNYDLSIVNSSINPERIVKMVRNAQKFSEKNKSEDNGIRMLFYGLSGTGKTELVRYIGEQLGKPVLLKRASDILNCYVGESEKNIKAAFEEAERTDSILLFDEADSFFQDRENARNSWEITQVNEFLTQMEEFSGILICTTNLRKIMDPAMQRRFHILSEFKALTKEGIEKLLNRYFSGMEFTQEQIASLDKYKTITPGDFASLYSKIRFMDEEEQTAENIFNELEVLQKEKKKNANSNLEMGFIA